MYSHGASIIQFRDAYAYDTPIVTAYLSNGDKL